MAVTSLLDAVPVAMVTKTVLVCDHHPLIRRSLTAQFTGNRSYLRVIQAVPDGHAAVDAFTTNPTDLVLIGVHRGTSSGPAAVHMLSHAHPLARIIVFGAAQDSALLIAALGRGQRADALGPPTHYPVGAGHVATAAARCEPPLRAALTDLERTLLRRISEGQTNSEMAQRTGLSEQAIKTRCRYLLRQLGVRDRAHSVALALRDGLLT